MMKKELVKPESTKNKEIVELYNAENGEACDTKDGVTVSQCFC